MYIHICIYTYICIDRYHVAAECAILILLHITHVSHARHVFHDPFELQQRC